uniref:Uncharacterized protein n=1 Tax=Oryza rufipogon TaxID=4529 RepID=A0A0E0Q9K1_ORYRU
MGLNSAVWAKCQPIPEFPTRLVILDLDSADRRLRVHSHRGAAAAAEPWNPGWGGWGGGAAGTRGRGGRRWRPALIRPVAAGKGGAGEVAAC